MKRNYILYLLFIASTICMGACNNDEDIDTAHSIFTNEGQTENAFDKWLFRNYMNPYNVTFKYRMEDIESDQTKNLVPADYDKSVALAKLVKYVWMEAYDEQNGINFLRVYMPKTVHLIGSKAYEKSGAVLGTAEGGMKITLYDVNSLDVENIDIEELNDVFFKTMHHEFAHVLHQTKNYDPAFDRITENGYIGSSWYIYTDPETGKQSNRTDAQAWQAGFVTPYAMSEPREDFAENIAMYVTNSAAYWENMLAVAGEEGASRLTKKFNIVYNYMRDTWGINLDELRSIFLRRQSEIYELDLSTIELADDF